MAIKRSRRKQTVSFNERLQRVATEARDAAHRLPPGPEREALLKRAKQAETAAHINIWLSQPAVQPR